MIKSKKKKQTKTAKFETYRKCYNKITDLVRISTGFELTVCSLSLRKVLAICE